MNLLHRSSHLVAWSLLVVAVGSIHGQGDILGVRPETPTTGAAAAPTPGVVPGVPVPGGMLEPLAPSLDYTWIRTTRQVARARYFFPYLDTPSFHNVAYAKPGGETGRGACWGYNLIVVTWLKKLVIPLMSQSRLNYLFDENGKALYGVYVVNGLRIKGPVTLKTLMTHHLHWYSSDHREEVARAMIRMQAMQRTTFNKTTLIDPPEKLLQVAEEDVSDEDRELTMLDVQTTTWGHSLLIWAIEEGFAGPESGGVQVRAYRFMLLDPNAPRIETEYLMYFPDAGRFSFSSGFRKRYSNQPSNTDPRVREALQPTTFFYGRLRVSPAHGWLAGLSRDYQDRTGDEVDSTTRVYFEGLPERSSNGPSLPGAWPRPPGPLPAAPTVRPSDAGAVRR